MVEVVNDEKECPMYLALSLEWNDIVFVGMFGIVTMALLFKHR